MNSRTVAGRYRLEKLVGEGGMATVYRATDLVLDRSVAVKLLREQYAADPDFVERFQREARAAATLSHPNIVGVYDLGAEGASHFIVMEYVEGETLKEMISREGPFPPARIVTIGTQLANALEYAHDRGVVHRDVKPQNILITRDGNVRVTDFGIAAAGDASELTVPGTVLGTATYISPEQAQGLPADPSSDIYSAGIVLYEMATGRPPFRASYPAALARMHLEDPPPRPTALNPMLPRGLEWIILKALAKDPSRRFGTAGDLAHALSSYEAQGAETIVVDVRPVTSASQWQTARSARETVAPARWGSRARSWLLGGLVLLALLVIVSVVAANNPRAGGTPTTGPSGVVSGATPPPAPTATVAPTSAAPLVLPGSPPASPAPAHSAVPSVATSTSVAASGANVAVAGTAVAATPEAATSTSKPAPSPTAVPPTRTPEPPTPSPTRTTSAAARAAVARVAQEGYTVSDASSYDESQQLRVLIGTAGPYNQKAFFFLGDSYLGTDTLNPSARISFAGQEGNVITIVYGLYRPQDPLDKPSGGEVGIHYQWNGTRLTPLEPIPPDDPAAELSRR